MTAALLDAAAYGWWAIVAYLLVLLLVLGLYLLLVWLPERLRRRRLRRSPWRTALRHSVTRGRAA